MIEINGLPKLYGRHSSPAVDHISLTIKDGEILGFVGLNGAGKTTTINCVSGVLLPSGGHVFVDGNDVVSSKVKASKGIGWVSEFPTFEQERKASETTWILRWLLWPFTPGIGQADKGDPHVCGA